MTLSVDEYLTRVLALAQPCPTEQRDPADCAGLVTAREVHAKLAVPAFTNSAMDGFAVRAADLGDGPLRLPVSADIPAGVVPHPLQPGTAARIMTGAMLPEGADAVVRVEDTDQLPGARPLPDEVEVRHTPQPGLNVRQAGEDVQPGDVVLPAHRVLDAAAIAAATAVGCQQVSVHRPPRVAVLTTGTELVDARAIPRPGQIPDSNGPLLEQLLHQFCADVVWRGRVTDEPGQARHRLDELAGRADLVITAGGISAGAYEVVKLATEAVGAQFARVAMQPGGPQGCGVLALDRGRLPLLALPGNPVSVFVSFHQFARPLLARLRGLDSEGVPAIDYLTASTQWSSPGNKRQYLPVRIEPDGSIVPSARLGSGSHLIASLPEADALAIVPEGIARVTPGMRLAVIRIRGGQP
jgi:molybdopterin molybdotransferase